jgi:hypothetical protein
MYIYIYIYTSQYRSTYVVEDGIPVTEQKQNIPLQSYKDFPHFLLTFYLFHDLQS